MEKYKVHKNIFLSNNGIASKGPLIILKSIQKYPIHSFKIGKRHLLDWAISNFAKSGKLKILDDNRTYIYIHYPWFNYFHWIVESIPRLINYKENLKNLTLIIPEQLLEFQFVVDSLTLFKFNDIFILPKNDHVLVHKLVIPKVMPFCYKYNKTLIKETQSFFQKKYVPKSRKPFRNIYVSRKYAKRRKFTNEQEVIDFMIQRGFEIHYLENYNLKEQVTLFNECKLLFSIHGAAMSNMMFMQPKTSVIEGYRELKSLSDHKSKVYKNLAAVLDINHLEISCKSSLNSDFFYSELNLDLELLKNSI